MSSTTSPARTASDPHALVGQWVRLDRDGGRPPHLGVLTRVTPVPDHPGLWQWALRTPTGYMVGGPHLPAEPLSPEHTADIARARRALARRLRADRDLLADLIAHQEPVAAVARAVADMEELEALLAAQLES